MQGEATVSIIVAIGRNGVIGAGGGLPWRLSSDLKRFKRDTMGKPVIMGRKTWETIGKPLPGRQNIVVSRDPGYRAEGADVVRSIGDGLKLAAVRLRCLSGPQEICVIGGGQVYRDALASADRLVVTHVDAEPEGDTFFPDIDPEAWTPVHREHFPAGEKDSAPTEYVVYERVRDRGAVERR